MRCRGCAGRGVGAALAEVLVTLEKEAARLGAVHARVAAATSGALLEDATDARARLRLAVKRLTRFTTGLAIV